MSLWNLPLPVDMPEVRTPTPAPLGSLGQRRRAARYGLTVTDASRATGADLARDPGCELVRRCAGCGACSSDSLTGSKGWRVLSRCSAHSVAFCPECDAEIQPLRVAVDARYAEACALYQDAAALAKSHANDVDAIAARNLARFVMILAGDEYRAFERSPRKAS